MGTIGAGRYRIRISHPDKVLIPGKKPVTKEYLAHYYYDVGRFMTPHIKGRPVTMVRYPDGIDSDGFYQQARPDYFPDWVASIGAPRREGGPMTHVAIRNRSSLAYLANQGVIEIHTWLSREGNLETPDQFVLDLDPSQEDFNMVRKAALVCRDLLNELGLRPFVMTSGSKGLHVMTPLKAKEQFNPVRSFAESLTDELMRRYPNLVTNEQRKVNRGKKVFLDYLRNAYGQSTVAPYSVRAKPGAGVAFPIDWAEVEDKGIGPQSFTVWNALDELSKRPDQWAGMGRKGASLAKARKELTRMRKER
jgi:bifunctional non-homologous end joining protein LigD